MSHTITITRLPDEESDDYEYEIGGEHDHRCESYRECAKAWHRHPKNADIVGDEWGNERVGEHRYIEGMWMVFDDKHCGIDWSFEADEPYGLHDIRALGTYPIEADWDGDWWTATITVPESYVSEEGAE